MDAIEKAKAFLEGKAVNEAKVSLKKLDEGISLMNEGFEAVREGAAGNSSIQKELDKIDAAITRLEQVIEGIGE